jgi:hypothetical protein
MLVVLVLFRLSYWIFYQSKWKGLGKELNVSTEKAPKLNILRTSEDQGKYTLRCISEMFAAKQNLREFGTVCSNNTTQA